ncbi:MAG: TRAP transporter TatT component family protein [Limisphaerales bacterium]
MRGFIVSSCSFIVVLLLASGCSIEKLATNKLADALAGSGTVFAADDDPELVRDAAPFSLKLMETVLAETPDHEGLLLALSSGFAQYGYAFVQQDAERLEEDDFEASDKKMARAAKLYRRARDYGLRALEHRYPNWKQNLSANPEATVKQADAADVPLLYWTAAAWGSLISLSKDDPETIAGLPQVAALADRALALDEDYDYGTLHSFMITFEFSRADPSPTPMATAKKHFERAMELSKGQNAGPLLAWVETVSIQEQNGAEFEKLLEQALSIDVSARPEWMLLNTIMQERARWLLDRKDDLIIPPLPDEPAP